MQTIFVIQLNISDKVQNQSLVHAKKSKALKE